VPGPTPENRARSDRIRLVAETYRNERQAANECGTLCDERAASRIRWIVPKVVHARKHIMTTPLGDADQTPMLTIDHGFPESSEFYRSVLDRTPTPVVVVDPFGQVVYANEALGRLGGWPLGDAAGTSLFEFIHPDDAHSVAEAFLLLAGDTGTSPTPDRPWAPINLRLLSATGVVIPVEVTGRDMVHDPDVGAVIYEVRPAYERDVFHRVMTGVASSGMIATQLDLVIELFAATPLEIDAMVICFDDNGDQEVISASRPELTAVFQSDVERDARRTFGGSFERPTFIDVAAIPGVLGVDLAACGYVDAWCLDIDSPISERRYRMVAFTPIHHNSAIGVTDRLLRAGELAAVVLLRSRSEDLLTYAAHHDQLTALPNRHGLLERLRSVPVPEGERAVLFVDLDGFKVVNDRHGHETGDEVLRILAQRLEATTRPGDVVSRIGGDEFAIVMGPTPSTTAVAAAEILSARILQAVSENISTQFGDIEIGASIGIAIVDGDSDIQTAISGADQAMYIAKRAGGGQTHLGLVERRASTA
jgi:diguanylate cyclase (GGDEF)-like protein/PAS domain S-box-containing protein